MKCIHRLSSVALVSFLCVNSSVAMSKVTEQVPNQTSSAQTEPMIIANPFGIIRDAVQTVDQVNQIRLREQRRQEAERRRQELEAARREATEQQRLEAERRRQYFESLSPEQKEAYLAEQRALRAKADKTAALLLLMLFAGSTGTNQQDDERSVSCYTGNNPDGTAIYTRMSSSQASGLTCSRY